MKARLHDMFGPRSVARTLAVVRGQVLEFRRDFGAVFLNFLFPLFFVVILVASNLVSQRNSMDFGLVNASNSRDATTFVETDVMNDEIAT